MTWNPFATSPRAAVTTNTRADAHVAMRPLDTSVVALKYSGPGVPSLAASAASCLMRMATRGGHAIVVNGVSADGQTFLISDSTGFHDTPVSMERLRRFVELRPDGPGTMFEVGRP